MNILLVRVPFPKMCLGFKGLTELEPLQLEYLAAELEEYNVKILDTWVDGETKLLKEMSSKKWDIIGFNSSAVHILQMHKYAKYAKAANSKVLILVGGEQPTISPGMYNIPEIDIIIFGEGVSKIGKIVSAFKSGSGFENVPGIAYRKNGTLVFAEKDSGLSCFNDYKFPNRELLSKYRNRYFLYGARSIATVVYSLGCPHKCNFCCVWRKQIGVQTRNPQLIIEELKTIKEEWVFFCDDNFLANTNIEEFLDLLEENNIRKRYIIECSAELIITKEKLVERFRKLGLSTVLVGLESFSEKDLEYVNKAASVEQNIQSLCILRKYNIDCLASVIVYPQWTKKDFDNLWQNIKREKITFLHLQCLTPYPGTELFDETFDQINSFNMDIYDMEHMVLNTRMSLKSFYREIAKIYIKTYNPIRLITLNRNLPFPLNPFHRSAYTMFKFIYGIFQAHKHSEVKCVFDKFKTIDEFTLNKDRNHEIR
ncbi:radical SAM protein [Bacteroides sp.]|uniref:B12-binding domain-containing radical SAM protein n=1 Tax=Bacteroides sp. TaxID=29523 RepID=UPI00260771FE|nr:radical SAM protein [Bacteroides sp.]MDD3038027.1 radical SAM protein [Bacteroides sp.]